MESKAIPTIEKCFYIYAQAIGYGNWENLMKCLQFEPDTLNKHIKIVTHEYAVLFAQHHREKQIDAIDDKIGDHYRDEIWPIRSDIENAYPIEKIK